MTQSLFVFVCRRWVPNLVDNLVHVVRLVGSVPADTALLVLGFVSKFVEPEDKSDAFRI